MGHTLRESKSIRTKIKENEQLYSYSFLKNGDVVFDVGANIGTKTDLFLSHGAKVVCFEPQPDCVKVLWQKYGKNKNVIIVEKGLAGTNGEMQLSICSHANTISTFSDDWKKGRFAGYKWDKSINVEVTTLDDVVQKYGCPKYVKIDVEGFEHQVLSGLSIQIPYISFEFTIEFLDNARHCVTLLEKLGYKYFNLAIGENSQLILNEWLSARMLFETIECIEDKLLWGDIYAKFNFNDCECSATNPQETIQPFYQHHRKLKSFKNPNLLNENNANNITDFQLNLSQETQGTCAKHRKKKTCSNSYDKPLLKPYSDSISVLQRYNLHKSDKPLRLHLGCGEQYLDGYINIDYPPSKHNVMKVKADISADLIKLYFPEESVDEIRLHHVFEHFSRVTALSMLIKWHNWLKIGGKLYIETPDLIGSAKTLLSGASWKTKMSVIRHLAGDQAASWAYHIDQWFPERFEHSLRKLEFDPVKTRTFSWQHEPYLSNVEAIAIKSHHVSIEKQLSNADELLWESTVALSEKPTYEVWTRQLRSVIGNSFVSTPGNTETPEISDKLQISDVLSQSGSKLPISKIYGFNQNGRDAWVEKMAATVPSGARVLDIGAGTCPYRDLFFHCDYKTHDFKKYTGVKLGGTTEYGAIDYVSDVVNIPVEDNSFDVILCTEVLEHVAEPIKALREMARITRLGGRIFLTAPLGSGLHQLPYHYYGGYTPEWYKHFCPKFGLEIKKITPNGGFFKLLSQECVRVAATLPQHQHLHGDNIEFVRALFGEWLPRYLFALEEKHFIDQFTVGYHVEMIKKSTDPEASWESGNTKFSKNVDEKQFSRIFEASERKREVIDNNWDENIEKGEIAFNKGDFKEAEKYFLAALKLDIKNKEAYNNLGVIAFQSNDIRESIDYFTRALQIDPFYKEALLNYTEVLRKFDILNEASPF